ncbi:MAG: hypothetical protein Q7O66_04955 [Dehalococcoidia bacterium]|nr:hypothetical protein [Dehalococcoidia bacterium]
MTIRTIDLNSKACQAMFKETKEAAHKALQQYGEPQMTLEELRKALGEQLGDLSLGEWIEKEREAGL